MMKEILELYVCPYDREEIDRCFMEARNRKHLNTSSYSISKLGGS